jgi:hypothetical protein
VNQVNVNPEYAEADAYGNVTVTARDCRRGAEHCCNCIILETCWCAPFRPAPYQDPRQKRGEHDHDR